MDGLTLGETEADGLTLGDTDADGDWEGETEGLVDGPAAATLTATNILAAATSPALVVALVSKFSLAGIVIAEEI